MTADERTWRVGIIGVNPVGLFLLEQMSLALDFRLVGVFDRDPARRQLVWQSGCELWDSPAVALAAVNVDVLLLMDCSSTVMISEALRSGKHVVLDRPWLLTSADLLQLHEQSLTTGCAATVATFRRGSTDFVSALTVLRSGRLGRLETVRMSSCEQILPREDDSPSLIREIGFQWLDQLLCLVESSTKQVCARRILLADQTNAIGLRATIEFTNGCDAQIEVLTRTRLSHRTGWMLEGSLGSYRGERLFTTTPDGEIVDEALLHPDRADETLIEGLVSAWRGRSSMLSSLADAARVVQLIETLERSAETRQCIS